MSAIQANIVIPTLCVHSPLDSTAKLNYTYRSKIINGAFSIWQRGVSFALSAAAYAADRWYVDIIGTVTREAFLPGESELMDNSRYYLKTSPSGSSPASIEQRIESVWTLAGKQTTLTFWAKAGISGSVLSVSATQFFGTAGSTSVATVIGTATLTTAWVKHTMTVTVPSIAAKTVGANDYLALHFTLPVDDVSICNVQWEQGPLATDFELRPYDEELRLCRRFYEQQDILVNQRALIGQAISGTDAVMLVQYAEKRAVPALTMPADLKVLDSAATALTTTWADLSTSVNQSNQTASVATGLVAGSMVQCQAVAACAVKIDAEL